MVPQKASGGGREGGGVGGGGRIPHFNWSIYRGGNFFFFFFLVSGLKLDEKSIENGLEGQKFLVVCLFWGGCHHPNNDKLKKCDKWSKCNMGIPSLTVNIGILSIFIRIFGEVKMKLLIVLYSFSVMITHLYWSWTFEQCGKISYLEYV